MENLISKLPNNISIDTVTLQKMVIIYNAVHDGWEVKKKGDNYIFIKKHEQKKEVYLDSFLKNFIEKNINIHKIDE